MKITHILWGLTLGGIESMVVNIVNHQSISHKVELIVVNDYFHPSLKEQVSSRCRLIMYNRKVGSKNILPFLRMNLHLLRHRPDIIHIHSAGLSKIIWVPFPIVRTIHNTRNKCDEYPRMRKLFSISKAVHAYTKAQGFDSILVENGIPTDAFVQKAKQWKPNTTLHILQLGRLDIKQKGQHILISAVERLVNLEHKTNIRVHFVGEGEDRSFLERMIHDKGLDSYFVFEGVKTQSYLKKHLKDYDLLVQPSIYEGFGLTVAEAMAAQLPVLVSDIEGPMEIIDQGKYGLFFKANDQESMANALSGILGRGFDEHLVEDAMHYVKSKYDVSVTAEKYVNQYQ